MSFALAASWFEPLVSWGGRVSWGYLAPATVVFLGALFALLRRQTAFWAMAVFSCLTIVAVGERMLAPDLGIRHGKLLPAAALLAFALCRLAAGKDARSALEACAGVIGGAYVLAGLSKLYGSGWRWFEGDGIRTLLGEHQLLSGHSPLGDLIVDRPLAGSLVATLTVLIELSGVFFLLPRLRLPLACAFSLFHAGVGATMGYWYPNWIALSWGVAILTRTSGRMGYRQSEPTQSAPLLPTSHS